MATTIVVTLDDDLTEEEKQKVKWLFCDAFGEFKSHRGPTPMEYVNKRYPNTADYSWLNRPKKIQEVRDRIALAEKIHRASAGGGIKVNIIEPLECSET